MQRGVGALQQAGGIRSVLRILGDPPAHADDPHRLPLGEREVSARDRGTDFGDGPLGLGQARVGKDQEELLAPEPPQDVVLANALLDAPSQLLEQLVPGQVPVGVVVVLEVVDAE